MKNLKLKILKTAVLAFFILHSSFCRGQDWTATTDSNGVFTWPQALPAGQLTDYTNKPFHLWSAGGGLIATIGTDGSITATNGAYAFTFSQGNGLSVNDNQGGFGYSNGLFWINANQFYQAIITQINTNPVVNTNVNFTFVTNFYNSLNALSNQIVASFEASNSIYLNAFSGSNATMFALFENYSNAITGSLTALIGTNGINCTNLAYSLGVTETNYAYLLITNNGALMTNLVYALGTASTNLAASTNWAAAHLRFGSFQTVWSGSAGLVLSTNVTFSPGFPDPSYQVYVTLGGSATNAVANAVSSSPYSYNSFNLIVSGTGANPLVNYLIYHP